MFVGQTRFSLFQPGSSGWKASSRDSALDEESYRDYLYSEERMESRIKIFLEHSIPTIAHAAKYHRIRHIVSYSESLPGRYKNLLLGAAREFDFIVLDERPDRRGPSDWRRLLDSCIGVRDVVGVYRLDDDDLLSVDFFSRMRKYLETPFIGMRVSFGLIAQLLYSDGEFSMPRKSHHPLLGIGLMDIAQKRGPMRYSVPKVISHNRSDRVGPVIVDSTELGALWVRSVNQDTAFGGRNEFRLEQLKVHLKSLQRVERKDFESKFPTLQNSVDYGQSVELLDEKLQVSEELYFDLDRPIDEIAFSFAYSGGVGLVRRDYIWSFRLWDIASTTEVFDVDVNGLTKTPPDGIGYYRYARTRAGGRDGWVQISLPDGIVCDQIRISPSHSEAPRLVLESIQLELD